MTKLYALKLFGKVKIIKAVVGFALTTWKFVMQSAALTHCAMLLAIGNNLGKKKCIELYLILLFIAINITPQYGDVPYQLKCAKLMLLKTMSL